MHTAIPELRALQKIIDNALDSLDSLYSGYTSKNGAEPLQFPSLFQPYDPNTPGEALTGTPEVSKAITLLVAAASQICASVQHPFLSICDACTIYHLPACLRVFEAVGAVELMKEAGESGVSIEVIAKNCPGGEVDSRRLAHIFRLLSTHHIITEVAPGDIFALNRISGCMVTHPPPPADLLASPGSSLSPFKESPIPRELKRGAPTSACGSPSALPGLDSAFTLSTTASRENSHTLSTSPSSDLSTSSSPSSNPDLRPQFLQLSFEEPLDFDKILQEAKHHAKADSWEVHTRHGHGSPAVSPKASETYDSLNASSISGPPRSSSLVANVPQRTQLPSASSGGASPVSKESLSVPQTPSVPPRAPISTRSPLSLAHPIPFPSTPSGPPSPSLARCVMPVLPRSPRTTEVSTASGYFSVEQEDTRPEGLADRREDEMRSGIFLPYEKQAHERAGGKELSTIPPNILLNETHASAPGGPRSFLADPVPPVDPGATTAPNRGENKPTTVKPEDKYVDTNGIAAFVGLCTDELFKASAYLLESLVVEPQYALRRGSASTSDQDAEAQSPPNPELPRVDSIHQAPEASVGPGCASDGSVPTTGHSSPISPTSTLAPSAGGLSPITINFGAEHSQRPSISTVAGHRPDEVDDDACRASSCSSSRTTTRPHLPSAASSTKKHSYPSIPPFNFAFRTKKRYFPWLEDGEEGAQQTFQDLLKGEKIVPNRREQEFRLARFGMAMTGSTSMEGWGGVWNAMDWLSLPKGSLIVDVGGGVGSTCVLLARGGMRDIGARFIVQDRGPVCQLGEEMVSSQCKELLDEGTVNFQEHDFFLPQPEHLRGAAVYLLRVVLHDWPDRHCRKILLRLREAVIEGRERDTKLVLAEFVLPLACVNQGGQRSTASRREAGDQELVEDPDMMVAPVPLLANLGKANANAYWMDLTMQCTFNSQERTLKELDELTQSAGWKIKTVRRGAGSLFGYIVAEPAEIPAGADDEEEVDDWLRASSGPQEPVDSTASNGTTRSLTPDITLNGRRKPAWDAESGRMQLLERSVSRCATPTFGSVGHIPRYVGKPPFRPSGKVATNVVSKPSKPKHRPAPLLVLSSTSNHRRLEEKIGVRSTIPDSPTSKRFASSNLLASPQAISNEFLSPHSCASGSGKRTISGGTVSRSSLLPLSPTRSTAASPFPLLPSSPDGLRTHNGEDVLRTVDTRTPLAITTTGLLSPPPTISSSSSTCSTSSSALAPGQAMFSNDHIRMTITSPPRPSLLRRVPATPSTPVSTTSSSRRTSTLSTASTISASSGGEPRGAPFTPRRTTKSFSSKLAYTQPDSPVAPPPQSPLPMIPGNTSAGFPPPVTPKKSGSTPRERRQTRSYGNLRAAATLAGSVPPVDTMPSSPSAHLTAAARDGAPHLDSPTLTGNVTVAPEKCVRERRATISSSRLPVPTHGQALQEVPPTPPVPRQHQRTSSSASSGPKLWKLLTPSTPGTPTQVRKLTNRGGVLLGGGSEDQL